MSVAMRVGFLCVACGVFASAAAGCGRERSSAAPPAAASSSTGDRSLSATARQVLGWLPDDRAASGWKRVRPAQAFGPDNLWESIDGGAEAYLAFGFQELVAIACADPAFPVEATVEVYRMGDTLNAFGIYAQERNPAANFVSIGNEGYTAPNIVNFWNGPYYVKLTATKTNDRIAASLLKLAADINARIGPPAPLPDGVVALPSRDQVVHSARYLPRDILGQSYLVNGFEAQYRIAGKVCRLVTMRFDSSGDAVDAFGRYKKFLSSSGRPSRGIASAGDAGFVGSDSFNGSIVAVRAGSTMAVTLGAPSERAALDLIGAFLSTRR